MHGLAQRIELLELLEVVVDLELVFQNLHLEGVELLLSQATVVKQVALNLLQ